MNLEDSLLKELNLLYSNNDNMNDKQFTSKLHSNNKNNNKEEIFIFNMLLNKNHQKKSPLSFGNKNLDNKFTSKNETMITNENKLYDPNALTLTMHKTSKELSLPIDKIIVSDTSCFSLSKKEKEHNNFNHLFKTNTVTNRKTAMNVSSDNFGLNLNSPNSIDLLFEKKYSDLAVERQITDVNCVDSLNSNIECVDCESKTNNAFIEKIIDSSEKKKSFYNLSEENEISCDENDKNNLVLSSLDFQNSNCAENKDSLQIEEDAQNIFLNKVYYSKKLDKNFKYIKKIGSGVFSVVILAECDESDKDVTKLAIKIISIPLTGVKEIMNFKSFILGEINILLHLNHPCIVSLLDYNISLQIHDIDCIFLDNDIFFESLSNLSCCKNEYENLKKHNEQYLFLNYCKGKNLLYFMLHEIKNDTSLECWLIIKRILCEFIVSIAYIHSNDIIHRDIKLENILLNFSLDELKQELKKKKLISQPVINVSDFGLSKKLKFSDELLTKTCGSQDYIAPEILMGTEYNGKLTDSWSVGVLIFSVLEDRLPFDLFYSDVNSCTINSPTFLRSQQNKNNIAYRISMVDWQWHKVFLMTKDSSLNLEVKNIISGFKDIVELLLVDKEKRLFVTDILKKKKFSWIHECIPNSFLSFFTN